MKSKTLWEPFIGKQCLIYTSNEGFKLYNTVHIRCVVEGANDHVVRIKQVFDERPTMISQSIILKVSPES